MPGAPRRIRRAAAAVTCQRAVYTAKLIEMGKKRTEAHDLRFALKSPRNPLYRLPGTLPAVPLRARKCSTVVYGQTRGYRTLRSEVIMMLPQVVLVVEDDAIAQVGLQTILRSYGYQVEVAADPGEAIRQIEKVFGPP